MANNIDGNLKVTGRLAIGNATAPPDFSGGSGSINTTNRANGSIHLCTDNDTLPQLMHNGQAVQLGLSGRSIECRMSNLTANQANTYTTYMPRKGIITGVRIRFATKPSSALGTVVIGITIGGNQILQSASEDVTGLTNDTLADLDLTATAAHLKVNSGDKIVITITSNNADMTGGIEPIILIDYDDN